MTLWLLMLACGLVTFLIRCSFIVAAGHYEPSPWFVRLLPFVPVAALTALTVPELMLLDGAIALGLDNPRFWAGLVAVAIAAIWRNTLLTIGGGFAVFFLLRHA